MKLGKLFGKETEIRNRHKAGESIKSISNSLGVTYMAVYFKLYPEKLVARPTSKQNSTSSFQARLKAQ